MSVKEFLKDKNLNPLCFCTEYRKKIDIKLIKDLSLEDLILLILEYSYNYYSSNEDVLETFPNKRRSVLDIWRHVIYFRPETTIYQVMNSLYEKRDKLFTNVCSNIHRRVFKVAVRSFTHGNYDNHEDEFGFPAFSYWKDISEGTDNLSGNYWVSCVNSSKNIFKFKIKDVQLGDSFYRFDFIPIMKLEGIHYFVQYNIEQNLFKIIDGIAEGCVYHISWLEKVEDSKKIMKFKIRATSQRDLDYSEIKREITSTKMIALKEAEEFRKKLENQRDSYWRTSN